MAYWLVDSCLWVLSPNKEASEGFHSLCNRNDGCRGSAKPQNVASVLSLGVHKLPITLADGLWSVRRIQMVPHNLHRMSRHAPQTGL